jgi:hypothetical protein
MQINPIDRLATTALLKEEALSRHVEDMNVADADDWKRELELTGDAMGANFALLQGFRLQHFLTRNLLTAI